MTVTDRSENGGAPEQDLSTETAETIPPPREKPRLEPLDDLVLEDDGPAETVEVHAASLDPMREKEPSRPSKKERTRPKITLRIPDDEVARPDPPKPDPRLAEVAESAPTHPEPRVAVAVAEPQVGGPVGPSGATEPSQVGVARGDRITRPDLADGTDVVEPVHAVSAGQRTSPLPPKVDTEEIEISIPSTPFVNIEPDPSEPFLPPAVAVADPVAGGASVRTRLTDATTDPPPAGLAGAALPSGEFESLSEGPFAPEADEDSWTPWQPTAVEQREAADARIRALTSETEVEEIAVDAEEDDKPPSMPPEIEVDDVLVVEEQATDLPPVRPRAPSVPAVPPMRPPYVTPTSIGMDALESAGSAPLSPPPPALVAPPPVHSAPQLHQVLAEGGPRVGGAGASAVPSEPKSDAKKRGKPWWEELFNDDYLRTVGTITDAEIGADANFIEDSLGVAKGATVLDLACGTGRHAIELGRRGYQVVGFDLSLSMLARASDEAQERGQKINFVQGDMREMTFEDAFDGVYCWQTSFGFFEEEKNAAVIGRVHRALRKGGQFLLDVVNRDYVAREAPSLVWFEGDGCICMDEMQMDFITSRLRIKRTMMIDDGRSKEIEYSVRAYSLHELGKLLHDAGFRVAEVTGKLHTPGVFFGCESPRIMILAEKR